MFLSLKGATGAIRPFLYSRACARGTRFLQYPYLGQPLLLLVFPFESFNKSPNGEAVLVLPIGLEKQNVTVRCKRFEESRLLRSRQVRQLAFSFLFV